jgi:RNA polymerase sigma-70 factor (ECF subfamily)
MEIDQEIIAGCGKGDRRSQFKLYEQCYPYMMSIALRYRQSPEIAAAAVNAAFLKVLNHMAHYRNDLSFKAWIRRIMINTLIDEYRKTQTRAPEKSNTSYEQDIALNGKHIEYNEAESNLNVQQLISYIHQLNPVTSNVFNLYVLDGFTHKDIADMLQITESASKWHLFTARKQLQEMVLQQQRSTKTIFADPGNIKLKINVYEK